ncbi:MAG: carbonate dehydratase [Sinobacteraceae bacterium]|nr:carbonate dehydratase [Nevskiaceae bacterium]
MTSIDQLLQKNHAWAEKISRSNPDFFPSLARQQTPQFLWIGCSDSRVPANQVVDLAPGEVFVHRNIANVVDTSDLNCLSVIQFAVDVLKVSDIIVTGHYGCGGVTAALEDQRIGLGDHWIAHVRDVYFRYEETLRAEASEARRLRMLCELNVLEQALNLSRLPTVGDAWARGQALTVHGWCYGLEDGMVQDLGVHFSASENPNTAREKALAQLPALQ